MRESCALSRWPVCPSQRLYKHIPKYALIARTKSRLAPLAKLAPRSFQRSGRPSIWRLRMATSSQLGVVPSNRHEGRRWVRFCRLSRPPERATTATCRPSPSVLRASRSEALRTFAATCPTTQSRPNWCHATAPVGGTRCNETDWSGAAALKKRHEADPSYRMLQGLTARRGRWL